MNHRLACLLAAGLALAADPHADVSASVYYPTPTVEILVGGAAQRQYPYQGRWYVEAAKGHAVRDSDAEPLQRPCRRGSLG